VKGLARKLELALLTIVLSTAGCGDGTLTFGGDFDDKPASLKVTGDVKDQTPSNATVDVVVFVFTNLTESALDAGPPFEKYPRDGNGSLDTSAPPNFIDQESLLLEGKSFSIPSVENGNLTIMFLLDDPQPDGRIDPGDNYAIFEDDKGKLRAVKGGRTVNIPQIEILYDSDANGGIAFTDKDITTKITPDNADAG
jgi:hypothetical protein